MTALPATREPTREEQQQRIEKLSAEATRLADAIEELERAKHATLADLAALEGKPAYDVAYHRARAAGDDKAAHAAYVEGMAHAFVKRGKHYTHDPDARAEIEKRAAELQVESAAASPVVRGADALGCAILGGVEGR